MPDPSARLFVKTGCPWCAAAIEFLDSHNIAYQKINVTEDPAAMQEMKQLSNQTKAPTLDWNGDILADFGTDELEPFLNERKII